MVLAATLGFLLAQAAQPAPPSDSPLSTGGILAIIAGIALAATSVINAWRTGGKVAETKAAVVEAKQEVVAVANATMLQDRKLDHIEVLVDGRYGEVLQELADVKKALAEATGRIADKTRAENAQKRANDQAARVEAAGKPPKDEKE
jgi:predicted butyrate kinase (DUF1464 family)